MTDEQAIRDLVSTWLTATKNGDIATVLGLMSDDIVFMVPGRPPFGKGMFEVASKGMGEMKFDGTSEIVELQILGDWAWMRTHLQMTITPLGGQPMKRSGYTLGILKKTPEGKWLLARDANLVTTEGK